MPPACRYFGSHVAGADIDGRFLPVAEAVDAGVLQNRPTMLIISMLSVSPGIPGRRAADPPDNELDGNIGLGRLGQLFHDNLVGHGVAFHQDAARLFPPTPWRFPVDHPQDVLLLKSIGGDPQSAVFAFRFDRTC